jgi:APA family basic amino acid/polyamine antiporter
VLKNCQPFVVEWAQGALAIAHNGNLVNAEALREKLERRGSIFQSTSDTEVIIHLIAASSGTTLLERIVDALAQVRGSMLDLIADRLLGSTAGNLMALVSIVSLLASVSAMTFAGPRVYFAMARDGAFFGQAATVHGRFRTPAVAIVAQTSWTAVLILSAKADALVDYTGFAIMLFSGWAVVSLFVLRSRDGAAARPFRAWGYPVAPALFVAASAAILVNGLLKEPAPTGAGLLIIAAGVPLYAIFRARR